MGFALAGVPHLVVQVQGVEAVDLRGRGAALRRHEAFAEGANVDFIAPAQEGATWAMRTYERGVEDETLACGTGAVSSALLLRLWGLAGDETWIRTRSGRRVRVILRQAGDAWLPSLSGEGRIVFRGRLQEIL